MADYLPYEQHGDLLILVYVLAFVLCLAATNDDVEKLVNPEKATEQIQIDPKN